jgi:hypothetical protein
VSREIECHDVLPVGDAIGDGPQVYVKRFEVAEMAVSPCLSAWRLSARAWCEALDAASSERARWKFESARTRSPSVARSSRRVR